MTKRRGFRGLKAYDPGGAASIADGVRCRDKGSTVGINISENAVWYWKRRWPASGMPDKALWFEVEKRNGDLIYISNGRWEQADGSAVGAMMNDAMAVCAKRKGWPGLRR